MSTHTEIFLSVVIPVYNEEESVAELHKELVAALQPLQKPYEIIFIDDGSTDATLERLRALSPIRTFSFGRNFGKAQAFQYGFAEARGRYIITMDGDLQDDPSEIPAFITSMEAGGLDLVCGWKRKRYDPFSKKLASKFANFVTRLVTRTAVHDMNCCFKIYRSPVAKNLTLHGDMHRYIPALAAAMGYRVGETVVQHRPRKYGASKYGFARLWSGAFDFVTLFFLRNFTDRPMHLFGFLGVGMFSIGALILAYLSGLKFFAGEIIGNRPLLTLGVLLILIGFQSFSLGFIGELIIRRGASDKPAVTIKDHFSHEGLS